MPTLIVFVHRFFKRRVPLVVLILLCTTVLCTFFISQLKVREDIRALLPASSPEITRSFDLLSMAPFSQVMAITISVEPEGDFAHVTAFAQSLKSDPHMVSVIEGSQQIQPISFVQKLIHMAPSLLTQNDYADFATLSTPEAVTLALTNIRKTLQTPAGFVVAPILSLDPLGLTTKTLNELRQLNKPGNAIMSDGYILDSTKRFALLISKSDLSMADTTSAREVMNTLRKAESTLPSSATAYFAGGYPYTEANADIIQQDLKRIIPISFLVLALCFVFFLRSVQGGIIFLVPIITFNIACAAAALIFQSISGIVIGFGSVILGIASDYPIHVYYSVRSAATIEYGLRQVVAPLLLGMMTTVGIFASFFISEIPALNQMATLAIVGVVTAAFCALVILPLFIRGTGEKVEIELTVPLIPDTKAKVTLLLIWCVLLALFAWFINNGQINGDIRKLAYTSSQIEHDEEKTREIWGNMREGTLIAVESPTLELALQKNERVWHILKSHNSLDGVTSVAPLLPSLATQTERFAEWNTYWEKHGEETLRQLAQTAITMGFSEKAFTPFADWIKTPPTPINIEDLATLGLSILSDTFISQRDDKTILFTSLSNSASLTADLISDLEKADASLISGEIFRAQMNSTTKTELIYLISIALSIIIISTFIYYRNVYRTALILLPSILSVTFILGVFYACNYQMQIFHVIAMPLVLTLSLDYGIFMLSYIERTLEKDTPKGVLLSALTTIGGFGCLIFAKHPALFSIGVVVSGGMCIAMIGSLIILPLITKRIRPCNS